MQVTGGPNQQLEKVIGQEIKLNQQNITSLKINLNITQATTYLEDQLNPNPELTIAFNEKITRISVLGQRQGTRWTQNLSQVTLGRSRQPSEINRAQGWGTIKRKTEINDRKDSRLKKTQGKGNPIWHFQPHSQRPRRTEQTLQLHQVKRTRWKKVTHSTHF